MYLKTNMYGFNPSEDTFDNIPISVATHLKSEPESRQRRLEVVSVVDQNRRVGDRHTLLQFPQEQHDKLRRSGRKEPNVEGFVRLGIDGGVQPATFIIHPDHRLLNRDVVRRRVTGRL